MKVRISGIKQAVKNLDDFGQTVTEKLEDVTDEAAINVERVAKKNVRVDTGRLRSSIHPVFTNSSDTNFGYTDKKGNNFDGSTNEKTKTDEAFVVTNVEYAQSIEDLDPFLFPAWEAERPQYIKRIKKILKR